MKQTCEAVGRSGLYVFLATGCLSGAGAERSHENGAAPELEVEFVDRPPSAYMALVRVLEVVDAMRAPDTSLRVRAVEGDTLPGREGRREHVRILLDVTLFARDFAQTQAALDGLVSALETEGKATARTNEIAPHRVRHVFREMPWSPRALRDEATYDGFVSVSNTLRVEVHARRDTESAGAREASSEGAGVGGSESVAEYIRHAALAEDIEISPLGRPGKSTRGGRTDLRYRIRAAFQGQSFTRLQIGSFLQRLEARSPGVRVTHLEISPADPGADVREDRWTFQADMTIRVRREE